MFGLLLASCLLARAPAQPPLSIDIPPPAAAYERWFRPQHLTPQERNLFEAVQSWAAQAGLRLVIDARLTHAARALLPYVPRAKGDAIDLNRARALVQGWGVTDGQLAAVAIRLPPAQSVGEAVVEQLKAQQPPLNVNRFGVASLDAGGEVTAVVLISHRLLQLMPIPARVRPNDEVSVAGRLPTVSGSDATHIQVVIGLANGAVERFVPVVHNQQFEQRIRAPGATGPIDVQVLLDRGRGPEMAALFPIGVGCNPRPQLLAIEAAAPTTPVMDAAEIEQTLISLILGARQAQDLPLPAESTVLTETARGHAKDMEDHGFFAHVSPTTGDVTDRLRGRGVRYRRVLENLAVAGAAEEIFQDWMASPAHRANLLDGTINFLGVGAVIAPTSPAPRAYAVAVLARLDEPVSEAAQE
jgi:uncharacterized protein YkwD